MSTGDLLQQKNPTCWVDTYEGGLSCCHHKNVLLDKDQEQPSDLLTYHLKFRFYYQPYEPEVETSPASMVVNKPASHQNLIRLYFQTEAWAGEYDIPKVSEIQRSWKRELYAHLSHVAPHYHTHAILTCSLYSTHLSMDHLLNKIP